jgi:hypothetical protein
MENALIIRRSHGSTPRIDLTRHKISDRETSAILEARRGWIADTKRISNYLAVRCIAWLGV